ncbi:MAG TPA: helix-turn-helix domain-containing protein [Hyphomonadaceae bacterium]|nr:helix-turn-helix domain-containing protein [Hyphomonadaceae bacterium]
MDARSPSHIDQHVGRRLVGRREELEITQPELADRLGVTYQQLQKYENGKNRITAGRLWLLARALDTTITYFYDGLENLGKSARKGMAEDAADFSAPAGSGRRPAANRDENELLSAFRSIKDPEARKEALAMLKKRTKPSNRKR